MVNKESCSIYCPCIEDTVKLIDCESCVNMKNGKCQYDKKGTDLKEEKYKKPLTYLTLKSPS